MSKKLKFLLLKILLLLFLILPLPVETILFLGVTFSVNFETTLADNSLASQIHIKSFVPKIKNRTISFPNVKKVTISQAKIRDSYYTLDFELEGIEYQPPPIPTDKETYEEVEKLIEKITDAVQNNKSVSYELLSGKKICSKLFIYWSLIYIFIIFIVLVLFIQLKRAERKTTENILFTN